VVERTSDLVTFAHTPPMPARRRSYDMRVASIELGFAIAAFACGLYDAPMWLAGLVSVGMLAYWNWTRRAILKRLRVETWASVTGAALMVIIAIQAGAYWLGLGLGERMS
jgi:hypothetical protein